MKKNYTFIHFVEQGPPGQETWSCRNNRTNDELGVVKWYPTWRRHCYFPTVQAAYSSDCLDDISHFVDQLD